MSVEENKEIVRRSIAAFIAQDLDALDKLTAPELQPKMHGLLAWGHRTYPGYHIEITDMVAEGDQVWVRASTSGGYAGGWMGIPATDTKWTNSGIFIHRLSGGRIVEQEIVFPTLDHLRQLGAKLVPPDGSGG